MTNIEILPVWTLNCKSVEVVINISKTIKKKKKESQCSWTYVASKILPRIC